MNDDQHSFQESVSLASPVSDIYTGDFQSEDTFNNKEALPDLPSKDESQVSNETTASTNVPNLSSAPLPSPNKDLPKSSIDLLNQKAIKDVLNSDKSLDALLKRFKESINNCEEFAKFIKKKAAFQEDYDYQVKKLAKNTNDYLKNNAASIRQDSFTKNFSSIVNFDEKLYNVGSSYVAALQTMSDELFQLSATMQSQRKALKEDGKRREKEVSDSINMAEKAKHKYESLCNELDKVRHYEPTRKFTLKNKTTSQQEEELKIKIENSDKEYAIRVNTCKKLKKDLLDIHRPAISKSLKDLILEIDLAMSVQLQKYATWCENLLMNSGVLISPLRIDARQPSMKILAASVDNEKDLYDYLMRYSNTKSSKNLEPVEYKVHPVLSNTQANYNNNYNNNSTFNSGGMTTSTSTNSFTSNIKRSSSILMKKKSSTSPIQANATLGKLSEDTSNNRKSYVPASSVNNLGASVGSGNSSNQGQSTQDPIFQSSYSNNTNSGYTGIYANDNNRSQSALPTNNELTSTKSVANNGPKMFGGAIEDLCLFENESVPLIVKTCINIIDNYGIELEGIYRTSGNNTKIHQLIDALNRDRTMINKLITNPENIIDSDMYCIASLLKSYFSQLPEPLLTDHLYPRFISAVKIPDLALRKKRIHEAVFELPDANYFTLRAIIFHLCRIYEKQEINRMSAKNLGIIWGPNLLPKGNMNPEDMSYQGNIVETLMYIAKDIFEPEE